MTRDFMVLTFSWAPSMLRVTVLWELTANAPAPASVSSTAATTRRRIGDGD
ncbi:hypothetical protein [Mycolicibacterium sp. ELW1]|uniref:hypothetical protein n=1 Tax=Mycolicibacterium sp. ELW1 TaxID=3434110 RepID=UPI003D77D878